MSKNNKIKVALVSLVYEPYWSGAEKMVKEIARGLQDKYEIFIITCRIDRTLPPVEKIGTYTIIRVGLGVGMKAKLLFPFRALAAIRRLKPDIVHGIMESYAGGAVWLCKYFYPRAKRILTLQSGDLDDPKKQSQLLIRLFWKQIHAAPHQLTAISNFLAARAGRIAIDKKVVITPNGVDLSSLPAVSEKIPERVICVGRLSWEKAHEYQLQAWPQVLKKFPNAKLVFVGEGKERTGIEKLINELKLGDAVELKGGLPHADTLKELARSEIFICPSLAEGLGIVFIEAQALGVPVIGTKVGGIPDVISDGVTGLLIEPRSADAIAGALIKLLSDKPLAAKLAAAAKESVKKFEWKNIIEQFDGIYRVVN